MQDLVHLTANTHIQHMGTFLKITRRLNKELEKITRNPTTTKDFVALLKSSLQLHFLPVTLGFINTLVSLLMTKSAHTCCYLHLLMSVSISTKTPMQISKLHCCMA